jgi:hypothetical protein
MKTIKLNTNNHNFQKSNLVTIIKGFQVYDIYKCYGCGITGKRYSLSDTLILDGRTSDTKIKHCTGEPKELTDKLLGNFLYSQ